MAMDTATKAQVQDYFRQGKEVAAEVPAGDFSLVPAEQRTRAAAAIHEIHAAEKDDIDPAYPTAALAHLLDDQAEPTKVRWVDVLGALSEAVQAEVDRPGSSTIKPAVDPEAGVKRATSTADELRRQVVGATDTFKLNKKVHESLRTALFGDRGQPKSRAEWEIEIGAIAGALRKPQTKAPPELRAFLPRLDASEKEVKAATVQTGRGRTEQVTWSLGVRETTYALGLALGRLLAQSFTKATPSRHGRLLRAIDPKRSADAAGKGAAKGKQGGQAGDPAPAAQPGATQAAPKASGA